MAMDTPQLVSVELSDDEEAVLGRVKEAVRTWELGEDEEELRGWLDTPCLRRFLRAREWDEREALKQLRGAVEWRRAYRPHAIAVGEIRPILALGSLYRRGSDRLGRPVLYIKPATYNPHPWPLRIRGLVYVLEDTIAYGVETMVWILDFTGYANRKRSEGGLKVAQNALEILQNQYPERLGAAFILNSPWWMSVLWTCLSPFMAKSTKKKIHWASGNAAQLHAALTPFIADEELESEYGGTRAVGADAEKTSKAGGEETELSEKGMSTSGSSEKESGLSSLQRKSAKKTDKE